jgi:hypothetical protein
MTDKQPEALILADAIEDGSEAHDKAAAELRRQHEVIQTLTNALEAFENRMGEIGGCYDGGCLIKEPKGMVTNGGCKCWHEPIKMQRLSRAAKQLRKTMRIALNKAKEQS